MTESSGPRGGWQEPSRYPRIGGGRDRRPWFAPRHSADRCRAQAMQTCNTIQRNARLLKSVPTGPEEGHSRRAETTISRPAPQDGRANKQQRQENAAIGSQQRDARGGERRASHRTACNRTPHQCASRDPGSDAATHSHARVSRQDPAHVRQVASYMVLPPPGHRRCEPRAFAQLTHIFTTAWRPSEWRSGRSTRRCEAQLPAPYRLPLTNPAPVGLASAAAEPAAGVQLRLAAVVAGAVAERTRRRAPREPQQQPLLHNGTACGGPLFRKRRTSGPPWLKRP